MGREKFVTRFQLVFRILKGIVFLVLMGLLVVLFVGFGLTVADVGASILAFIPTGWFILLVRDSSCLPPIAYFCSYLQQYTYMSLFYVYLTYCPVHFNVAFFAPCRLHN